MPKETNRRINMEDLSNTQDNESDYETIEDDPNDLNLFDSETDDKSPGNVLSLKLNPFKKKNYINPNDNSQPCRHGVEEPHMCLDTDETEESTLDVVLSQQLREECSELKDKNYNSILGNTLLRLMKIKCRFPHLLFDCFIWMKSNTKHKLEEISRGICAVALSKSSPGIKQALARETIIYGLSQIKNQDYYFLFRILVHFVQLLKSRDAKIFLTKVIDALRLNKRSVEVKMFVAALTRQSQRTEGAQ